MSIADFSIKRPVFAWMLMSAMIIFGAITFMRLGVSQMPDVDFPILTISVNYEGAAPSVVESDVAVPIEGRVISVEGVKEIRSSIRQGGATIRMEFEMNRDINAALQEVQTAMGQLKLPATIDPPVIKKANPDEDPILWLGVASEHNLRDTVRYVDLVLMDQLQVVPGVGEVTMNGFAERNLRIWIDHQKLKKNLLTVLDVANAIQTGHVELAAGSVTDGKKNVNVRAMGEAVTPEEAGSLYIRARGSEVIRDPILRVRDVARVEDGTADVMQLSRISGTAGIGVAIKKQRGSNEVEVAKAVRAKVDELNKTLAQGYKLQINADFSRATEQIVKTTEHKLAFAALVTGIICFIFLGSWTSAVNVLMSIPTSIFGTFVVLYFAHFTLNLFTLLALTLVISIVVDDAIMMLENIVRHFKMGKSSFKAASEGANEIWGAAVAASLAVIAIFLPVVFMKGIIGKFFFQFGIAISTAVFLSLVEAVTLTPMRCAFFMKRGDDEGWLGTRMAKMFETCAGLYRRTLVIALNWRWTVVTVATLLFIGSLLSFQFINKEFVPSQDQNLALFILQTPPGTALAATDAEMRKLEGIIKARPEVEKYVLSVGAGGQSPVLNNGQVFVTMVPKDKRTLSHQKFMELVRKEFKGEPGTKLQFRDLSTRGLTSGRAFPVAFNIRGPDYAVLLEKMKVIMKRLDESKLVADLDSDYKVGQQELQIKPDREQAALRGVTTDTITRTLNAAFGGLKQGQFTNDGRRYDIRISLPNSDREEGADVSKLYVRNYLNEMVPLTKVIQMQTVPTVQTLTRINRSRAISVWGNVASGKSQGEALAAAEQIAREVLPEGYTFALEGAAQTFDESFGSLYFALALGIMVAYMVLASQFNSFLHPVSILLALPFSISGALFTLLIFRQSLNLYSMIGVLLLMGIAKKNSILLVEFTNKVREGEAEDETGGEEITDLKQAQVVACPVRLRPILMTSAATIVAALPLALDRSPGSEARIPMALAIIGGSIVSTLFTLYVVPCAYNLLARFEGKQHHEDDEEAGHGSGSGSGNGSGVKPKGHWQKNDGTSASLPTAASSASFSKGV